MELLYSGKKCFEHHLELIKTVAISTESRKDSDAITACKVALSRQRGAVVRSVVFTMNMIARLMVQLPT